MGDVVAGAAVAAGDAAGQQAVFINQRYRHAVDLQFDNPFDRFTGQQLRHPLAVLFQLVEAVGVFDREHRHAMVDRREALDRLLADALRGAIGRDQFRMLCFESLEMLDEPVVLGIGNIGGRLDVVLPVVVADFFAKPGDFRGDR